MGGHQKRLTPPPIFSNTDHRFSISLSQLRTHLVRISWFIRLEIVTGLVSLWYPTTPARMANPCLGTPLHASTWINAFTNHYSNSCAQPHTIVAFLSETEQAKYVLYKVRHIGELMYSVLASVIGLYF